MKGTKTSLGLKCLMIVVALAVLAAPTVQARAANSIRGSETMRLEAKARAASAQAGWPHITQNRLRPKSSTASYFWAEAGIAAAVLAGFVVFGLWGDVAIGGLVFGIGVLAAGAGLTACKAYARVRQVFGGETASGTLTPEERAAPEGLAQRWNPLAEVGSAAGDGSSLRE